jgi:hypothetical protein
MAAEPREAEVLSLIAEDKTLAASVIMNRA